ncbi:MAG: hypothetical protein ACK5WV_15245 [Chryseotalea sp.]|jgi:hypothetical protein
MKKTLVTIFISLGLGTAYSQDKSFHNIETDTIVFVNFNESDLETKKKTRLLEARQQNKISDSWDLEQFYSIDPKWFNRYMDKLDKELKKGKIKYKFISTSNNSITGDNCSVTTDFKIEESKSGKHLIIFMTSKLLDKDGKLIMDGDATGIIKQLRGRKENASQQRL